MKIIMILLSAFMTGNAFAQTSDIFKRKPWEVQKDKTLPQKFLFKDLNKKNRLTEPASDSIIDKSVINIELKQQYIGSNGKGADVYIMKPYNMPCISPDSTFHSNMPVAGGSVVTTKRE